MVGNKIVTGRRPRDGYVKSSFSDGGGQCVLVRRKEGDASVFLRDSKYQRNLRNRAEDEPIIELPEAVWLAFEDLVLNRVSDAAIADFLAMEYADDGSTVLRGPDGTMLLFTEAEWSAFRAGLAGGEFEPRTVAA
ncbi:DUF397 domain-containing protein [Nocardia sp. SYP-A9097]|uniref:DUF397 domain-containing protein n=1 Tax=Nocardia sp. SYP-A9097 TaxID=2663237 RepID=UPI00129AC07E|nr:DUF397 domain-containing protein [Nocardia sp. SYP-A9097]MRH92881.1 DUF397 domain-containing protein [Nocardia sp. SYP-A9097]